MKQANVYKIDEKTYRFTEAAMGTEVYMYLLIGTKRALLIDTAYGFTDVPAAIREITDLPLSVINTHGHLDHMHGNHMYNEVMISEKDDEVFQRHTDYEMMKALMMNIGLGAGLTEEQILAPELNLDGIVKAFPSHRIPLPEDMCIELGDRRIRIIETPGHTQGSICLLDESNKRLFAGDTACIDGVLLQFPESTDVYTFGESIETLRKMAKAGEFDVIYPGHQDTPVTPELLDVYKKGCEDLLAEDLSEEIRKSGTYDINGRTKITFDPEKIRVDR